MAKTVQLSAALAICALLGSCGLLGYAKSGVYVTEDGKGLEAAEQIVNENMYTALRITNNPEFDKAFTAKAGSGLIDPYGMGFYATAARQVFEVDMDFCSEKKVQEYATTAHNMGWNTRIRPLSDKQPGRKYVLIARAADYRNIFVRLLLMEPGLLKTKTYGTSPTPTHDQNAEQCYLEIASRIACVSEKGELCTEALNKNQTGTKEEYAWPR